MGWIASSSVPAEYDEAFQAKQSTLNGISVNSNMLPHKIDRLRWHCHWLGSVLFFYKRLSRTRLPLPKKNQHTKINHFPSWKMWKASNSMNQFPRQIARSLADCKPCNRVFIPSIYFVFYSGPSSKYTLCWQSTFYFMVGLIWYLYWTARFARQYQFFRYIL